jgi:Cys-tRNA(Pro)/Cys-tRNA(Cys) deacylase
MCECDLELSLEQYLSENNVWHRFVEKAETIHTADAAKATGIALNRVTKNLVSVSEAGEYLLLIVPGDRKVNLDEAAKAIGVKKVELVRFEKAERISGYAPGGTPSVGHKTRMRTIIDSKLLDYETVYCGGGSRNRLLELRVQDIIKLDNGVVAQISQ